MTINGINGVKLQAGLMGMNQATDSYGRNLQKQIADAQKELRELSSNEDLSLEEKMKKRQEIQQHISDLNMQLRQYQMELRKEAMNRSKEQQDEGSSMDGMPGGSKNKGLSQASMTAVISADSSLKQAKVQGSVATRMDGRTGVLESEIKLDKVNGGDTRAKEAELTKVEQKAQTATASQLSTLADASKSMEEAAKADSKSEKTDNEDIKTADSQEKAVNENVDESENENTPQPTAYASVDIRL